MDLVILPVSSALCVHQLSMWVSKVTVTEFAVETRCSSCIITALLNVFQTCTQSEKSKETCTSK